MPLKKISNRDFKRTYKHWITDGIQYRVWPPECWWPPECRFSQKSQNNAN